MVSSLNGRLTGSATLRITNEVSKLTKSGKKVYNFGIGEPDFTTPQNIIRSAFEYAEKGKTHYTPSKGIIELREKISRRLLEKNKIKASPENIIVTPSKFSIYITLLAIIEPGDSVMLFDPYYLTYPDIIRLAGGKVITVPTGKDYDIDFDLAQKFINPSVKVVIFNSPANPTGKVYDPATVRKLAEFVSRNNLYLISDEIYDEILYEGSILSPGSIPEIADRTITLNGFSKSHAMTGWRIGYMAASKEIIDLADKIQQATITCDPSISQYAALEALSDEASPRKMRDEFLKRRDLVDSILSKAESIEYYKPQGAFYVFVGFRRKTDTDELAVSLLREESVSMTPGSAFGELGIGHLRISFAASTEDITEGLNRFVRYVDRM
jgi:aspartate aminotransferase